MGYPRPKYFFSGLPNLLPQKIRLPWFLFSLESVTSGEDTYGEAPQKIRLPLIFFFSGVSYIWGSSTRNGQWVEEFSRHCPHRQTDITVNLIYKIEPTSSGPMSKWHIGRCSPETSCCAQKHLTSWNEQIIHLLICSNLLPGKRHNIWVAQYMSKRAEKRLARSQKKKITIYMK